MPLTKILITVKTYPTISAKYDELVCTAGFREDGTWIRIYPVSFRKIPYKDQYKKYDWVELDLVKNKSDFRPESYRPKTIDSDIKVVGHIGTDNNWQERKNLCLGKVYLSLSKLIEEAKHDKKITSLAVFKPTEVIDFYAEPVDRDWSRSKLEALTQYNLFESNTKGEFEVVKKLPYKFKYRFKDVDGKISNMMIEDWETCQLFWRQLAKYEGDEIRAIEDVRKKYFDDLAKSKDLYFYLGTTKSNHYVSRNPFMIIGTFHPKKEKQLRLF